MGKATPTVMVSDSDPPPSRSDCALNLKARGVQEMDRGRGRGGGVGGGGRGGWKRDAASVKVERMNGRIEEEEEWNGGAKIKRGKG